MPVTVDSDNIDPADTGSVFAAAIKTEFVKAQADLNKMSEKNQDETISGGKTLTGLIVKTNAFFSGRTGSSGAINYSGTPYYVVWTSVRTDSIYTLSPSTEIEVDEAGWYKVSYDGAANATSGSYTIKFAIQVDDGGGFSIVTGTESFCTLNSTDAIYNAVSCSGFPLNLVAGDKIRMMAVHVTGGTIGENVNLTAAGTRIFIEKI